jgi:hypothetical protein
MHIMHNLRNPRCTAGTKCRAKQFDRPLKSCLIDHLLWNHGSSLTFVRGTLTDHFSRENDHYNLHDWLRSVLCTEEAYWGSYRTHRADICTRLCMTMHMCKQTKSVSVHAHMHKMDLLITQNKRYARYFMDVISSAPMRRDFSSELFSTAAHRLKFPCILHKNSKSCMGHLYHVIHVFDSRRISWAIAHLNRSDFGSRGSHSASKADWTAKEYGDSRKEKFT